MVSKYVMVPVPEDLVDAVTTYTLTLVARSALNTWTTDNVREFYDGADAGSRALLVSVARAAMNDEQLTEEQAAEHAHLTVREAAGIVREFADAANAQKLPAIINSFTADDGSGRRLLRMPLAQARQVLDHAHGTD